MALKKSELYSSLWASCDELRGGMDASQYKDYVLVLLFVKYISDRYAGQPYAPISIPKGASFADMVALKGKSDIGDQINKKILGPLAQANKLSDMPDFNEPNKLGSGKEMVERLTNLIAIFENPALDFSKNRADGDDLLGDAYEYLMRHFATESGKSKGQFYTPAEVSRIIAQILGIRHAKTTNDTTVYDPTCGSGSLLLKIGDEARHGGKDVKVTLYGQEKDNATAGLARMNMILHDYATADIKQGNTLASPLFLDGDALKTFDYVVANPPFSDKRWSTGLDAEHDPWQRFQHYGVPPGKQGDYAYLLHILRSLKSTGKGACILPHGVLFRGGAEGVIRRNLVQRSYLKGIIGLPPNLFFGTGIPACIVMLDKEGVAARKSVFMIDASKGFIKDATRTVCASRTSTRSWTFSPDKSCCRATLAWCPSARSPTRRTTTTSTSRAISIAPSRRMCRTLTATCVAAFRTAILMDWENTGKSFPSSAPHCSKRPTAPATPNSKFLSPKSKPPSSATPSSPRSTTR
jgi:type I restriction enzyme M protein